MCAARHGAGRSRRSQLGNLRSGHLSFCCPFHATHFGCSATGSAIEYLGLSRGEASWTPVKKIMLLAACGYMCLYSHTYTNTHKKIQIYIYIYTHIYIYIYIYVSVYTFSYTHTYTYTCSCVLFTYLHICIFIHLLIGKW